MTPHHQWESDLAYTYSDTQWQYALKTIYKATKITLGTYTEHLSTVVHDTG